MIFLPFPCRLYRGGNQRRLFCQPTGFQLTKSIKLRRINLRKMNTLYELHIQTFEGIR